MALDAARARKILGDVLAIAKRTAPGADVFVRLGAGRSANTRFAKNEITSTGDVEEMQLSIRVAFGKRHAAFSTNQTDPASARGAVDMAARLARLSPEDPEAMPLLGPQKYKAVQGAYDPTAEKLGAEARAKAAGAAIAAAEAADLEIAGYYEHSASVVALASSAGLFAHFASTQIEFTTTARTTDGSGSGWAGVFAARAADVDPAAVARVAADKAVRSRKPRRLEPGRYTVVLEPAAVQEMLTFLSWSLDARRADEGRSFFSRAGGGTRVGETIFGDQITFTSDPTSPATPNAPFDGEGLPRAPLTWIDRGRVAGLVYSRYWAAKQGKTPTGFPNAWQLAGGTATAEDLVRGVKRGVLITRVWYTRWVDPQAILITGLTRDGTFLIENGEVVGPVNNFRFNESPVTMLKNADALTRDTVLMQEGASWRVPALRTHEFNLASISEAV